MSTRKPATTYVDISEVNFQSQIVKLAKLRGWKVYHTYDSRKSQEGFPDLILIRDERIIAAELKTRKKTTTTEQREWLNAFVDVAETVLWRPDAAPFAEQWRGKRETSEGNDFGDIGLRLR